MTDTVTESNPKGKWRLTKSGKVLLCIIIILAALLAALAAFTAYASAYDKIYPGTSISGIELGGKTKEEAGALLSEKYSCSISENSIELICEGESARLNLDELGAEIDIDATVSAAYQHGRDGALKSAYHLLCSNFHKSNLDASIIIDEDAVRKQINDLAKPFETPMSEYTYDLTGNTLTIIKGSGGIEVDRAAAVEQIKHEISQLSFGQIALTPRPVEPEPLDADTFYGEITAPATDAKYVRKDGKVVIEGGKPQIITEKSKIKELIDSGEDRASVQVEVVQPNMTKERLEAITFRDMMGTFSSKYNPTNTARSNNVALAASRINGTVLLPGETFSYDKTVKSRTKANGYKEAPVYVGNKVESGTGGGICQTSSTLYSAVLYSNLEIVERKSHSLPVSYMPAGQDATIAEGAIDFQFRNNTDYPIKITASAAGGTVSCSILGTKATDFKVQIVNQNHSYTQPTVRREYDASLPKGTKKILQKGSGGYSTSTTRIVTENGVEVKREAMTASRYNASETVEAVNPEDKNTPSEQLTLYSAKTNQDAQATEQTSAEAPTVSEIENPSAAVPEQSAGDTQSE